MSGVDFPDCVEKGKQKEMKKCFRTAASVCTLLPPLKVLAFISFLLQQDEISSGATAFISYNRVMSGLAKLYKMRDSCTVSSLVAWVSFIVHSICVRFHS